MATVPGLHRKLRHDRGSIAVDQRGKRVRPRRAVAPMSSPVPGKIKCCPRRAGRSARMRVRFIPLTSLRAYHTTPRAQSWTSSAGGGCRGLHPGRRAVGRCQVNGMKLEADGRGFRRPRRGSRSSRRCAGGGRPRGRGGV
jgi:hypothetical protein